VHDRALRHFPDPEHGEWYGWLRRDGVPTHHAKGSLWKGPFHLPRAGAGDDAVGPRGGDGGVLIAEAETVGLNRLERRSPTADVVWLLAPAVRSPDARQMSFVLPGTACRGGGSGPSQRRSAGNRSSFESPARKSNVTLRPV